MGGSEMKPETIMNNSEQHREPYEVWVQNREKNNWYCRRHGFDTVEEAEQYVKQHTENHLYPESFKVVKSEITIKLTVLKKNQ